MSISNVSFSGTYNTREIANIVAGKEPVTTKFLSSLTGVSQDKLLCNCSSDVIEFGSQYCINEIAQQDTDLSGLRQLVMKIKAIVQGGAIGETEFRKLNNLLNARDKKIDEYCGKHGDTIEIPDIDVPIFNK